jgi:hypothetical protein
VNRLPGTALGILLLITPFLLGQSPPRPKPNHPWNWPWVRPQSPTFTTAVLPNPGPVIQRDRAVAEYEARLGWQRQRNSLQQRHRAQLERYVETRLALAEERARVDFFRAEQLARSRSGGAGQGATSTSVMEAASSAAGAWVSTSGQNPMTRQPRPATDRFSETAKHIVREVPKRTKQIIEGNDELVTSNMAHGLPKGLAVFMALLMLHVPSVAVASLFTGIFLIRGHRTHSGAFFLGVAAILTVVIFFVLPW